MFVCKQFACLKQKRGFVYTKHRVRLKIFRVYVCAYTVHVLDKVKERERERDCHILLTGNSESVSETSLIMIFLTDCDLYFAKTKFDDFRGYGICTVHKNDSTYMYRRLMDPSFSIDQSDTTFIIRNSVNKKAVTMPQCQLHFLTSVFYGWRLEFEHKGYKHTYIVKVKKKSLNQTLRGTLPHRYTY